MYRYYYVTLCGFYRGQYAVVFAKSGDEAYSLAVKQLGILNVSTAYTEKAFERKKPYFKYYGHLRNPDEQAYLRRKRII